MSIYGPPLGEPPNPTSQEARDQLAAAARIPIASRRDRRLPAAVLTLQGLLTGAIALLSGKVPQEEPWQTGWIVFLAVCFLGLGVLQQSARLVPRHTRKFHWVAGAITLPLLITGLVILEINDPPGAPWWVQALVYSVVALPYAFAGCRILSRGPR